MNIKLSITIFLAIILSNIACDPLSVNADREEIIVPNPTDSSGYFSLDLEEIDFGILDINEKRTRYFKIINNTNARIRIDDIRFKRFPTPYKITGISVPFSLDSKGKYSSEKTLQIDCLQNFAGVFEDEVIILGDQERIISLKSAVPLVKVSDINFLDYSGDEYMLKHLFIENRSNAEIKIDRLELVDDNSVFSFVALDTKTDEDFLIGPGEYLQLSMLFKPNQNINYEAKVVVYCANCEDPSDLIAEIRAKISN